MTGRPKAYNQNPVRRKKLPDIDRIVLEYRPIFEKVCLDLKKTWWKNAPIYGIEEEIESTVNLVFYTRWDLYKKGEIDEFPPPIGYLYQSARFFMFSQWAPYGDVRRHRHLFEYDQIENGDYNIYSPTGNVIFTGKSWRGVAAKQQQMSHFEPDQEFDQLPDLVDLWCMGFSIKQLTIIYGQHSSNIRMRLNNMYDALDISGVKMPRGRPRSRHKKGAKNRLKRPRKR